MAAGKELELAAKFAGLSRRTPQMKLIDKDLLKKEKVSLRDKIWARNHWILFGIGAPSVIASFILMLVLTSWVSILFFFVLLLAIIVMGVGITMIATREDAKKKSVPSVAGRIAITKAEKSRLAAPHAGKRKARFKELNFKYNQYSVELVYGGKSVMVSILQHRPWKDGRYKEQVLEITPGIRKALEVPVDPEMTTEEHETTNTGYVIDSHRIAQKQIDLDGDFDAFQDEVHRTQRAFEDMAERLEEVSYQDAVAEVQVKRFALMAKRG